jgi:hypothetical protein
MPPDTNLPDVSCQPAAWWAVDRFNTALSDHSKSTGMQDRYAAKKGPTDGLSHWFFALVQCNPAVLGSQALLVFLGSD